MISFVVNWSIFQKEFRVTRVKPTLDFTRLDESSDVAFYRQPRLLQHVDLRALEIVEKLYGQLIGEDDRFILDLMCGFDSHLAGSNLEGREVTGLGLNLDELRGNPALTGALISDVNAFPVLPFRNSSFDIVLNTLSIAYMTQPLRLFQEVSRVLRPGGLLVVLFSNRFFESKATKVWRESDDYDRLSLVEGFLNQTEGFESPGRFVGMGYPRPAEDRYASLGLTCDPIFALLAEKTGSGRETRSFPCGPDLELGIDPQNLDKRKAEVYRTLSCPHCESKLKRLDIPNNPFSEWDTDFLWICDNDACPYLVRGWARMFLQGNVSLSYRFTFHPYRKVCSSIPVRSLNDLRSSIG